MSKAVEGQRKMMMKMVLQGESQLDGYLRIRLESRGMYMLYAIDRLW
jgi:hypothetical protein